MKCWQNIETAEYSELRKIQSENLVNTIRRVYDNVKYYREKMDAAGVKPEDIKSVEDLSKLPFTYKTDLRDNYPFNTFAVPMEKVIRIHASSGTTGKQTVVGYTKNDIEMWADSVGRCLYMAGATSKDRFHIAYGYGLFTGGLGLHYGVERIGATVIPVSGGNTERQIRLLKDFESTFLCCTPSYALYIADEMEKLGVKKEELKLKAGIFGAEPWTDEMKSEIEKRLGIKAYDIYGLSEIAGPGVSMSCEYNEGLHVAADNFIPEIIDPETGAVLPYGETGELVFTCVTKEALPLIRYRTRDLSSITYEKCKCGRTSPRMSRIMGRSDDMMIIRGVNVFPTQIESVLLKFGEVAPHYMIYVDRINNLDVMEVKVEMNEKMFSDEIKKIEAVEKQLKHEIESVIGISAAIRLVEPRSLPRSEGKAKRVIDNRKF